MNDKIDRFGLYAQRPESNLSKEFIEECLQIFEDIDNRKVDEINWEERAKMDEVSRRNSSFYDPNSDMYHYLNNNGKQTKNKKVKKEELKATNEKEKALMEGLADLMGKIDDFNSIEKEDESND
jgi:hypothetical protein